MKIMTENSRQRIFEAIMSDEYLDGIFSGMIIGVAIVVFLDSIL